MQALFLRLAQAKTAGTEALAAHRSLLRFTLLLRSGY
jgi:hypothetical protein